MNNSNIESSLKKFLKRKVKIAMGFLIIGAVGFAVEDKVAVGEEKSYAIVEEDGTLKL